MTPSNEASMNEAMKHLPTTADRDYVIRVNAEKASRAHQLMTSYIRGQSNKEKVTDTPFNPSSSHTVTAVPTGPPVGAPVVPPVATPIAQPQIEEQSEEPDREEEERELAEEEKSVAVSVR